MKLPKIEFPPHLGSSGWSKWSTHKNERISNGLKSQKSPALISAEGPASKGNAPRWQRPENGWHRSGTSIFFRTWWKNGKTINHENWGHMGSLACESCGMLRISPGKFGGSTHNAIGCLPTKGDRHASVDRYYIGRIWKTMPTGQCGHNVASPVHG